MPKGINKINNHTLNKKDNRIDNRISSKETVHFLFIKFLLLVAPIGIEPISKV